MGLLVPSRYYAYTSTVSDTCNVFSADMTDGEKKENLVISTKYSLGSLVICT